MERHGLGVLGCGGRAGGEENDPADGEHDLGDDEPYRVLVAEVEGEDAPAAGENAHGDREEEEPGGGRGHGEDIEYQCRGSADALRGAEDRDERVAVVPGWLVSAV